jgi:NADH dehydrogenase FAD-containing subunit
LRLHHEYCQLYRAYRFSFSTTTQTSGVEVITSAQVAQVNYQQIKMVNGDIIPADIIVWAARE